MLKANTTERKGFMVTGPKRTQGQPWEEGNRLHKVAKPRCCPQSVCPENNDGSDGPAGVHPRWDSSVL